MPETIKLQGVCEASGGALVNGKLWVVDDEQKGQLWEYAMGSGSGRELKFKWQVKDFKLNDLEGWSAGKDGAWAITSGSLGKKGWSEERSLLVWVGLDGAIGQTFVIRPDPKEEPDLKTWKAALEKSCACTIPGEFASKKSKEGGLDIEGLVEWQGELLAGLRGPVTADGRALVVRMKEGKPEAGWAITLGEGRGIRAMEVAGDRIFLVAGPMGETQFDTIKPFTLFSWVPGQDPVRVDAIQTPPEVPRELVSPEGLVWDGEKLWMLLDEGGRIAEEPEVKAMGEEVKCKDMPESLRYSRMIALPVK
jgi:hypothetical protein